MNQRYQRACEIVGCHELYDSTELFVVKALKWLLKNKPCLVLVKNGGAYYTGYGESKGDTLTEALTEAVLAVEQT